MNDRDVIFSFNWITETMAAPFTRLIARFSSKRNAIDSNQFDPVAMCAWIDKRHCSVANCNRLASAPADVLAPTLGCYGIAWWSVNNCSFSSAAAWPIGPNARQCQQKLVIQMKGWPKHGANGLKEWIMNGKWVILWALECDPAYLIKQHRVTEADRFWCIFISKLLVTSMECENTSV